jgi:hypothetical protein
MATLLIDGLGSGAAEATGRRRVSSDVVAHLEPAVPLSAKRSRFVPNPALPMDDATPKRKFHPRDSQGL